MTSKKLSAVETAQRPLKSMAVVQAQFIIALTVILKERGVMSTYYYKRGQKLGLADPGKWLFYCIGHCMDANVIEYFISDYMDFAGAAEFKTSEPDCVDHSLTGNF